MQIKRILCPTDFSENSQAAIDYGSQLAHANDAAIVFVHVTLPPAPFGAEHLYVVLDTVSEELKEEFRKVGAVEA